MFYFEKDIDESTEIRPPESYYESFFSRNIEIITHIINEEDGHNSKHIR